MESRIRLLSSDTAKPSAIVHTRELRDRTLTSANKSIFDDDLFTGTAVFGLLESLQPERVGMKSLQLFWLRFTELWGGGGRQKEAKMLVFKIFKLSELRAQMVAVIARSRKTTHAHARTHTNIKI